MSIAARCRKGARRRVHAAFGKAVAAWGDAFTDPRQYLALYGLLAFGGLFSSASTDMRTYAVETEGPLEFQRTLLPEELHPEAGADGAVPGIVTRRDAALAPPAIRSEPLALQGIAPLPEGLPPEEAPRAPKAPILLALPVGEESGRQIITLRAPPADALPHPPGKKPAPPGELDCLTEALYFEARGETANGLIGVAEVILNRRDSARYPDTVCKVVRQGAKRRRHRCQFSYMCDGLHEVMADRRAYRRVRRIARLMLEGHERVLTGGALFYHARSVRPHWISAMRRTAVIGSHLFYRMQR